MLNRRRLTSQQIEAEKAHRERLILSERRKENGRYFSWFVKSGLVSAWETVYAIKMPQPDLTMAPQKFMAWLGMNLEHPPNLANPHPITFLQLRLEKAIRKDEEFSRTRAIIETAQLRGLNMRRARMLYAQVRWADRDEVRSIYRECRRRNQAAGEIRWHVDHIVPIAGKAVSGLHVPGNLRIISAKENLSKGRKLMGLTEQTHHDKTV